MPAALTLRRSFGAIDAELEASATPGFRTSMRGTATIAGDGERGLVEAQVALAIREHRLAGHDAVALEGELEAKSDV